MSDRCSCKTVSLGIPVVYLEMPRRWLEMMRRILLVKGDVVRHMYTVKDKRQKERTENEAREEAKGEEAVPSWFCLPSTPARSYHIASELQVQSTACTTMA
jgi:hypothetical protein